MPVIQRMSEQLANKIAAGEVIERPASVVKELVENAIDAQATVVEITIEQAGTKLIQVSDNGKGMEYNDALYAFERHATSKLKDEYGLFHIETLGFRGEALPSIAAIAKVTMQTSVGDEGTKVVIHGGKLQEHATHAAKKGTVIRVEQLFYNTPARLKYLKSTTTEMNHILDYVTKTALAQPQLRLRLQHNGRMLFQSSGNGELRHVLATAYTLQMAKTAVIFEGGTDEVKISGIAALPEHQKTNRNAMTIVINGRVIKNYAIQRAIIEAYYTMIHESRFPIVVLHITMDPTLLDVNVHPAKLEVRLSQEAALQQLVKDTIRQQIQQYSLIPTIEQQSKKVAKQTNQTQFWQPNGPSKMEVAQAIQAYIPPKTDDLTSDAERFIHEIATDNQKMEQTIDQNASIASLVMSDQLFDVYTVFEPAGEKRVLTIVTQQQIATYEQEQIAKALVQEQKQIGHELPMMQVIGQLFGTYILAQGEGLFYLIDQHVAQERIKYEQFMHALQQRTIQTQLLLVPLTLEVSAVDFHFLSEQLDMLAKVGVIAESFGVQSFIVRALPTFIPIGEEQIYMDAMFELLLQQRTIDSVKLQEAAAIMQSCKKSIKANHSLSIHEMQILIQQLSECEQPYNCPHGRPIIVQHRQYEIEKWFKRVM